MATVDFGEASRNFERIIVRKMEMQFERQMNRLINKYEQELRDQLVDVASGYTIQLVDEIDDYQSERRIRVEIKWPDDKTEDGDDEVESTLQEGEER
jgi:phage portal protein BeeE